MLIIKVKVILHNITMNQHSVSIPVFLWKHSVPGYRDFQKNTGFDRSSPVLVQWISSSFYGSPKAQPMSTNAHNKLWVILTCKFHITPLIVQLAPIYTEALQLFFARKPKEKMGVGKQFHTHPTSTHLYYHTLWHSATVGQRYPFYCFIFRSVHHWVVGVLMWALRI